MAGRIDGKLAQPTMHGLSHLARHQRGMRGSAAERGHDSRRYGETRDIGGAGIGSNQNDRVAARRQARRAVGIECRAPTATPADAPVP